MSARKHLLILGILFVNLVYVVNSAATFKKRPTLEDARLEYVAKWSKVAELYRTDLKTRRGIDYANWYHAEYAKGRLDDPRPPAIDIPAIPFECDPRHGTSPEEDPPQTVHELRPGDISVIGALGDSITAGNGLGAEHVLAVLVQNRGEAFSVGGDFSLEMNVSSIPNMIKKYNPDLKGQAECATPDIEMRYSWFNVAVPGARAVHLPEQVDDLITKMKNDPRVVYAKDWKMVTLFIGGNDFCSYCNDREARTPEIFKAHIQETLDKLHDHVPRAFVNLVPMAHVGDVQNVTFHHPNTSYPGDPEPEELYPWICELFHDWFCPCVMNDTTRAELAVLQQDYFRVMKELVDSRRYDTKDDFTVVLQPHLKDQEPMLDPVTGMTDNRYFSPDCFHPNRRMHQVFAYLLWNTMLTPVGQKPTSANPDDWPTYLCPSEEHPFLYTHVNSVTEPNPVPPTTAGALRRSGAVTGVTTMVIAAWMAMQR